MRIPNSLALQHCIVVDVLDRERTLQSVVTRSLMNGTAPDTQTAAKQPHLSSYATVQGTSAICATFQPALVSHSVRRTSIVLG